MCKRSRKEGGEGQTEMEVPIVASASVVEMEVPTVASASVVEMEVPTVASASVVEMEAPTVVVHRRQKKGTLRSGKTVKELCVHITAGKVRKFPTPTAANPNPSNSPARRVFTFSSEDVGDDDDMTTTTTDEEADVGYISDKDGDVEEEGEATGSPALCGWIRGGLNNLASALDRLQAQMRTMNNEDVVIESDLVHLSTEIALLKKKRGELRRKLYILVGSRECDVDLSVAEVDELVV